MTRLGRFATAETMLSNRAPAARSRRKARGSLLTTIRKRRATPAARRLSPRDQPTKTPSSTERRKRWRNLFRSGERPDDYASSGLAGRARSRMGSTCATCRRGRPISQRRKATSRRELSSKPERRMGSCLGRAIVGQSCRARCPRPTIRTVQPWTSSQRRTMGKSQFRSARPKTFRLAASSHCCQTEPTLLFAPLG